MDKTTFPLWLLVTLTLVGGGLGGLAQIFARLFPWSWAAPEISHAELLARAEAVAKRAASFSVNVAQAENFDSAYQEKSGIAYQDGKFVPIGIQQFLVLFMGGLCIGMAGAAGINGVFTLIKVFDENMLSGTSAALIRFGLEIFGVSVIGGFSARSLLPVLGENLSRRVNENEKRVDRQEIVNEKQQQIIAAHQQQIELQEKRLAQQTEELQQEKDRSIIGDAFMALRTKSQERWVKTRDEITELLTRIPSHREATVLAARFCVERLSDDANPPDCLAAIAILDKFINRSDVNSRDLSDVLLNRGCYNIRLMVAAENDQEKEQYRLAALSDLKRSFELNHDNRAFAQTDKDLEPLWEDPAFLALVRVSMSATATHASDTTSAP